MCLAAPFTRTQDNRIVGDHIRDSIESLLLDYKVDLTIAGHVHSYYRSCPAADLHCTEKAHQGVTHFVIGTAGHELSDVEVGGRAGGRLDGVAAWVGGALPVR